MDKSPWKINKPNWIERQTKKTPLITHAIKLLSYCVLLFMCPSIMATGLPNSVPSSVLGPIGAVMIFIFLIFLLICYGIYYGIFVEGKNKRSSSDINNSDEE